MVSGRNPSEQTDTDIAILDRLIEPFQEGETSTFMEHAKAGIEALARDPSSILVFSGYVWTEVSSSMDHFQYTI